MRIPAALLLVPLLGLGLAACSTMESAMESAPQPSLADAVAAKHRTPANVERDRYRHPLETLEFFGIKPDQTVVEVWPSLGWYTEIIAPYVREQGKYYGANFVHSDPNAPAYRREFAADYAKLLASRPELYDRVVVTELGRPSYWTACPAGTADVVLTFRNVHNWVKGEYENEMFQAFHAALKPGGVLGVVEHRAKPGTSLEDMKQSGYVTEAYVIELAEKAGFKLDGKAEINANPKDTTIHPEGVWTLPPALRLKEQDRDKYLAIGESDRMTLRFVKAAN